MIKELLLILKNYIPHTFIEYVKIMDEDDCYMFLEILNHYIKVDVMKLININARIIKYNAKLWQIKDINDLIIEKLPINNIYLFFDTFHFESDIYENILNTKKSFMNIELEFNDYLLFIYMIHLDECKLNYYPFVNEMEEKLNDLFSIKLFQNKIKNSFNLNVDLHQNLIEDQIIKLLKNELNYNYNITIKSDDHGVIINIDCSYFFKTYNVELSYITINLIISNNTNYYHPNIIYTPKFEVFVFYTNSTDKRLMIVSPNVDLHGYYRLVFFKKKINKLFDNLYRLIHLNTKLPLNK